MGVTMSNLISAGAADLLILVFALVPSMNNYYNKLNFDILFTATVRQYLAQSDKIKYQTRRKFHVVLVFEEVKRCVRFWQYSADDVALLFRYMLNASHVVFETMAVPVSLYSASYWIETSRTWVSLTKPYWRWIEQYQSLGLHLAVLGGAYASIGKSSKRHVSCRFEKDGLNISHRLLLLRNWLCVKSSWLMPSEMSKWKPNAACISLNV